MSPRSPSPPPDLEAVRATYDAWYQERGAHWEEAPGKSVLLAALKRCCDPEAPLRLLDVGCGTGSFLERVRREVAEGWELHGVDLSPVAVAAGRERHPELHLEAGDGQTPDYEPASFDVVTCYGSWEHFPDPGTAIAGAARVLRPGGFLLAMIPTLGVHRTDRIDEGWYEDTEVEGSDEQQMQWNLSRSTWEDLFTAAGVHLLEGSLARWCGAHKPGVFFFGLKLHGASRAAAASAPAPRPAVTAGLAELGHLAALAAWRLGPPVEAAAVALVECVRRGGKILACGNGGSAADAQHFVAELVGRLRRERRALPAISLHADPSVVTALANDYGYERVFARQVQALGRPADALLVISTSGRSPNILQALHAARERGLTTLALLGPGELAENVPCEHPIHVPHGDTQRIQEIHTAVLHALCAELERGLDEPQKKGRE